MYDSVPVSIYNSLVALAQIATILVKVRPAAVVGCGPAVSVLASALGKLVGAKAIYVETGSRVRTLSLSGKIMYHFADLFFVQWPPLKDRYLKAIYAGRL